MTAMALIQAAALIPGTSRSGSTMTAGMFAGLTKKAAAEISFLMSIPVIAVSGGLKFIEIFTKEQAVEVQLFPLFIGFIAAAISGLFAIWFLMRIIEKWSFTPFVIYRILIGILILIFLV
jgi:undecaprenyl-diphosphatase